MKKYFCLPVMVAAIASVVSCKNDKTEPAPGEKTPSVILEAGEVTHNSLTFTVRPHEADKCAYICAVKGEEKPDAAAVLSDGTSVLSEEPSVVNLSDVQPETAYVIWAVASYGDVVSAIAELEMTTEPEGGEDAIFLDRAVAARYYGRSQPTGTVGNYYLILGNVDAELASDNTEQPASDGCLLYLDLWSALPSGSIEPESGTYMYSGSQSRMTFDPFHTLSVIRKGAEFTRVEFSDGAVTLSRNGEEYVITARMVSGDGIDYHYRFIGKLDFDDLSRFSYNPIDEDVNTTFIGAKGVCYGDKYEKGSTAMDLLLYDAPLDAEGGLAGPGVAVVVEFNTSLDENADAVIPSGVYRVSAGYAIGTISPGDAELINLTPVLMGTYVVKVTTQDVMYGFASEGTVNVSVSGETYSVEVNLTVGEGRVIKGTYRGTVDMLDQRGGGGGISTLRRDTYPDLSGIEKGVLYYLGDMWRVGLSNFVIDLSSDGVSESMQIEVFCERDFTADIPQGTYEMMLERKEEYFVPYAIMQGYPNESRFFGTWYFDWDTETGNYKNYAPAVSGSMELSKDGDIYTVEYKFKDDCTEPNRIEGSWSGPLDFISSPLSLVPAIGEETSAGLSQVNGSPERYDFRLRPVTFRRLQKAQ